MALGLGGAAQAQSTTPDLPPPVVQNVDANGVDLTTGLLNFSAKQVSIGPSAGGLSRVKENFQVEDNYYGAINSSGSTYTVSVGAGSESFTLSGGVYTSNQQSGSTLTYNASSQLYTYTTSTGSVAVFSTSYNNTNNNALLMVGTAEIISYTTPTGEALSYNYYDYETQSGPKSEPRYKDVYYLSSVTSNRGLQIKYSYQLPVMPGGQLTLQTVQAVNNVVDYCAPISNNTCANTSQTWPIVNFSGTSATDALNRTTNYGAPAASSTQTITRPAGDYMSYTYDSSSRVTSATNGVGSWTYGYSTSGGVLTVTVKDPNANTRTVTANTSTSEIATDKDALGRITAYAYDGAGRLTSVTHPHGDVITYTYDENETSQRGNVTTTTWTPAGGGTPIVAHSSYDSSCTYAAKCNKPNTTTDARGAVTTYTYDNTTGVLLSVTRPAVTVGSNQIQPQTRYSYTRLTANVKNASGSVVAESAGVNLLTDVSTCNTTSSCTGSADETHVHITYDPNHNLAPASVTTYAGDNSISSSQSFAYDPFGNLSTSTSALGAVTTYVYDADRELTGVIGPDPDGSGPLIPTAAQVGYDGDGRVVLTRTGSVNSATDTGFSSFTTAVSSATAYDSVGRLGAANVIPGGQSFAISTTQYQYDNANNLQCTAVRMNPAGYASLPAACTQSTAANDGPDHITYQSYNADNSLGITVSGFGTSYQRTDVNRGYNGDGTLSGQADGKANNTCFGYDGFGRLSYKQLPNPSNGGSCNSNDYEYYQYDANGNLTSKRQRDGSSINYAYDALNRLTTDYSDNYAYDLQGRVTGASTSTFGLAFTYDALGRKTLEYNSFGGAVNSAYDPAGDRTQLIWNGGQYVTYSHDLLGRVTAIGEDGATSGVGLLASYAYNSFGQITSIVYGGVMSDGYQYDGVGRLSLFSHGFADTSKNVFINLTYTAAGQLRTRNFTNDLYDWNGSFSVSQNYANNGLNQVTTAGPTTFGYDARGGLSSDGVNTYTYDAAHDQLAGVSASSSSVTLGYDALHRLTQTQGASTTRFVYDGSELSEEMDTSGNVLARYVPGADGTPLLWYNGSGTSDRRWLLKDQQGSVIAVANSSGQSLAINTYDPYGMPGSANLGRFQYASYAFVPEVGLYNTGARSYSPTLGRFLQTDPIGYGDGMNWYAYTHGDPVNRRDPFGLQSCSASFGGGSFSDDGTDFTLGQVTSACEDQGPNPPPENPADSGGGGPSHGDGGFSNTDPGSRQPFMRPMPQAKPSLIKQARGALCIGAKALQNYSDFDRETANDALVGAGVSAVVPGGQGVAVAALSTAGFFDIVSTVEAVGSSLLSGVATGDLSRFATRGSAAAMTVALPTAVGGTQMDVAVDGMKAGASMASDAIIDSSFQDPCESGR